MFLSFFINMENISKYVGIPHYFGEHSFEKADCIGLMRLFYHEHGWIELDDGLPIEKNWHDTAPSRIIRFFNKHFDKTRDPHDLKYGDIIIVRVNGDLHFLLYIGYGKALGMQVPCVEGVTMSTIYTRRWWQPYFIRGYKRK